MSGVPSEDSAVLRRVRTAWVEACKRQNRSWVETATPLLAPIVRDLADCECQEIWRERMCRVLDDAGLETASDSKLKEAHDCARQIPESFR